MNVIYVDFKHKKKTKYQDYRDKRDDIQLDREALAKTIDFVNRLDKVEKEATKKKTIKRAIDKIDW